MRRSILGAGLALVVGALGAAISLVACGDSFTASDGADGGGGDAVVVYPGQDEAGDVPPIIVPDVNPPADACAAETASDADGTFVSASGGGSACSMARPCSSIQTAIGLASSQSKPHVYILGGTYTESITLAAGVSVHGGWDIVGGAWTRACKPTGVVLQAPPNANVTVTASYSGSAALDTLTILSKPAAAAGESIYGVLATGATTTLELNDVSVSVAAGGRGGDGDVGSVGTNGASGGCTPAGTGDGPLGNPGAGAAAGTFDIGGYHPASGTAGMQGVAAPNGAVGAPGNPCVTEVTCDVDCNAQPDGTMVCGTGGTPGCGGGGSGGGHGGTGGGSSIAVYVWAANVTVHGSTLIAADGGRGGNGGVGGTPGAGAMGTAGAASSPTTSGCQGHVINGVMVCDQVTKTTSPAGGKGGPGGTGGRGGQGGGGAGGASFALYAGGGATPSLLTTSFKHGAGGTGGSGGSPPAASGAQGDKNF